MKGLINKQMSVLISVMCMHTCGDREKG